MSTKSTVYLTGKIYWAKILGEPVFNTYKGTKEWSFDLELDEESRALLKEHKLLDRIKDKGDNRLPYITLRKAELNKAGKVNDPIRIYDGENQPWNPEELIGNKSVADVKIDIVDYGVGKIKGIYPIAIRVTEHVPYKTSDFAGMDAGKPAPKPKVPGKTFMEELDDDIPM